MGFARSPKGNFYSRLERLEASPVLARSPGEAARERLLSEFFRLSLDAMAHVKRESIDDPKWRYILDDLRGESLIKVAAYVAALTDLGHPDEGASRELLSTIQAEREVDATTLWECIDAFATFCKMRGEG